MKKVRNIAGTLSGSPEAIAALSQAEVQALPVEGLREAAKALYDASPSVKPRWDQLGDVTQSVWIDRVKAGWTPAMYDPPSPPPTKRATRRKQSK